MIYSHTISVVCFRPQNSSLSFLKSVPNQNHHINWDGEVINLWSITFLISMLYSSVKYILSLFSVGREENQQQYTTQISPICLTTSLAVVFSGMWQSMIRPGINPMSLKLTNPYELLRLTHIIKSEYPIMNPHPDSFLFLQYNCLLTRILQSVKKMNVWPFSVKRITNF